MKRNNENVFSNGIEKSYLQTSLENCQRSSQYNPFLVRTQNPFMREKFIKKQVFHIEICLIRVPLSAPTNSDHPFN